MIGMMVWSGTLHTDQPSLALSPGTSMTTLWCIVVLFEKTSHYRCRGSVVDFAPGRENEMVDAFD